MEARGTEAGCGITRSQKPRLEPWWGLPRGHWDQEERACWGGTGPFCPQIADLPFPCSALRYRGADLCRLHFPGSRSADLPLANRRSWWEMGSLRKGEARVFFLLSLHLGLHLHQQPSLFHGSSSCGTVAVFPALLSDHRPWATVTIPPPSVRQRQWLSAAANSEFLHSPLVGFWAPLSSL